MGAVLTELVELMTSGLTEYAAGIGTGMQEFATSMFLKTSETGEVAGLSTLGGLVAIFGGVSLAIGLSTLFFNWVTSLGN